jgi:hypothetical protein
MRSMIRRAAVVGAITLLIWGQPLSAAAVTMDQILALAKAGVTDVVILALIDRDHSIFAIEPEQLVTLQREGLSEKIILAMLKSGRQEGEQAVRTDAASNAAWIASNLANEPHVLIVGHGPDRPNTPHIDGFYSGPPAAGFAPAPYDAPTFRYRAPAFGTRRSVEPRALCYAQINTLRTLQSFAPFVTECPAVMQPHRQTR